MTNPMHFNDDWNAQRLVERVGDRIRYVGDKKQWFVYADGRWARDTKNVVLEYAKKSMRDLCDDACALPYNEGNELLKHAQQSRSRHRLEAALFLAQSDPKVVVTSDQFDRDPWKLNVRNGTLDIRSGALLPHTPDDLITQMTNVAHDALAEAPVFMQFLQDVFGGNAELIADVQRFLGYCLTGDTSEHVLTFCYGTGANGKGTLMNTFVNLLGDYALALPLHTVRQRAAGSQTNDIADLKGKRFALVSEFPRNTKLDEGLVKALTGGDQLNGRRLYGEYEAFQPQAKLVICSNAKADVPADDNAYWRRIRLVPFERTFSLEEQDPTLAEKLRSEGAGILNWALSGARDYAKERRLLRSGAVSEATDAYRSQTDTVGRFVGEWCVRSTGAEFPASACLEMYKNWCTENGERPVRSTDFKARLEQLGVKQKRKNTGNVYLEIAPAELEDADTRELDHEDTTEPLLPV